MWRSTCVSGLCVCRACTITCDFRVRVLVSLRVCVRGCLHVLVAALPLCFALDDALERATFFTSFPYSRFRWTSDAACVYFGCRTVRHCGSANTVHTCLPAFSSESTPTHRVRERKAEEERKRGIVALESRLRRILWPVPASARRPSTHVGGALTGSTSSSVFSRQFCIRRTSPATAGNGSFRTLWSCPRLLRACTTMVWSKPLPNPCHHPFFCVITCLAPSSYRCRNYPAAVIAADREYGAGLRHLNTPTRTPLLRVSLRNTLPRRSAATQGRSLSLSLPKPQALLRIFSLNLSPTLVPLYLSFSFAVASPPSCFSSS